MPGIVEGGAVVGDGEFVDSLNVPRIFDSDRSIIRQRFQQRQVSLAESFRANAINQLDHSQALFAEPYRHSHDRACLHLRLRVLLFEEPRIGAGIGHHDDFASLRHPTRQALTYLDANIFQGFSAFARGDLEEKLALFQIHKEQRPCIRPQHLVNFFHDGAEHLVELQRRSQRLAKLVKYGYFVGVFWEVQTNTWASTSFYAGERFPVRVSPDGLTGDTLPRVWRFWGQPIHYRERFPVSATALTTLIYNWPTAK